MKLFISAFFASLLIIPFAQAGTVLIVSTHPDDETIGAGGKIIQSVREGDEVWLIMMTDGAPDDETIAGYNETLYQQTRRQETISAMSVSGLSSERIMFLDHDDWGFVFDLGPEGLAEAINDASELLEELNPDQVYLPSYEHGNIDHDTTHYIFSRALGSSGLMDSADVYEYIEYNPFHWGSPIPEDHYCRSSSETPVITLPMSEQDILTKKTMLTHYKSQDLNGKCISMPPWSPITGEIISGARIVPLREGDHYPRYAFPPEPRGSVSMSGGEWDECEQSLIDTYYFGPDMYRELQEYDYTQSPCKDNSCTWVDAGTWRNNDFYGIIRETDELLGLGQSPAQERAGFTQMELFINSFIRLFLLPWF